MKTFAITAAATVCAVAAAISARFIVPAAILVFRAIEESFAPTEPQLAVAAVPAVVVTAAEPSTVKQAEPKPQPRKARRRKPSAKTLAAIQAIA